MEIHLKINDVLGVDDDGRHILYVDAEQIRRMLKERKLWQQLLDDNDVRNTIYMQEKARREAKAEQRERHRLFKIEKQRKEDNRIAARATAKAIDFYHNVLGIDD